MGLNRGNASHDCVADVGSRLRKPKWAVSPAIAALLYQFVHLLAATSSRNTRISSA
jgi:hypothetical protein